MDESWFAYLYVGLENIAISSGYRLAIIGSYHKDLELISIPWLSNPIESEDLIKRYVSNFDLGIIHNSKVESSFDRKSWGLVYLNRYLFSMHVVPMKEE